MKLEISGMMPRWYCLSWDDAELLESQSKKREKDQSTEMSMESYFCHAVIVPYVHSELQECESVLNQPSEMLLLH